MLCSSTPTYSSGLSSKGALLEETLAIFRQIDQGCNIEQVRAMVVEQDLLGKTTQSTRESVWDRIHSRYLGDIECVYPRYAEGFSGIDKAIVQRYFDDVAPAHLELTEWSPQTRDKVISNTLTVLRDFGLLQGTQRKTFSRLHVPTSAFVYVLYWLTDDSLSAPRQVLEDGDWRLFFLEQADVLMFLDEATHAGHCTFEHRGGVYTLDLHYPSLEACVEAITRESWGIG
jgi:hypothetical protein